MTHDDPDPLGLVGSTIDKYEIAELIGEGGFSYVYRGQHLIWAQPVAIKFFAMLRAAKPALRERLLQGFVQEGKLMTELSSRSAAIVQARDIGRIQLSDGGWIPYMVLEWLDGTPLDIVLAEEQEAGLPARSLDQALALLEPAAEALDLAHRRGVAHRDLKPANLMVMGQPRSAGVPVKVLDFGIAKVMGEHEQLQEQLRQTGHQLTAFTPHYGAPEQFSRKHGATGPWTDVYAMALIVLELMRGGEPVLAGSSLFEVGAHSCDPDNRPTPKELGLHVPPDVDAVFAQALAIRPAERHTRMGEFWSALKRVAYVSAPTQAQLPATLELGPALPSEPNLAPRSEPSEPRAAGGSAAPPSAPTRVNPHGATVASLATSIAPLERSRRWPVALVAGLGLAAAVAVSAVWLGAGDGATHTATPPPAAAIPEAVQSSPEESRPVGAELDEEEGPQVAMSEPSSAASALQGEDAGAPGTGPVRSSAPGQQSHTPRNRPAPSPPAAADGQGRDPWDPNSFGGRR